MHAAAAYRSRISRREASAPGRAAASKSSTRAASARGSSGDASSVSVSEPRSERRLSASTASLPRATHRSHSGHGHALSTHFSAQCAYGTHRAQLSSASSASSASSGASSSARRRRAARSETGSGAGCAWSSATASEANARASVVASCLHQRMDWWSAPTQTSGSASIGAESASAPAATVLFGSAARSLVCQSPGAQSDATAAAVGMAGWRAASRSPAYTRSSDAEHASGGRRSGAASVTIAAGCSGTRPAAGARSASRAATAPIECAKIAIGAPPASCCATVAAVRIAAACASRRSPSNALKRSPLASA